MVTFELIKNRELTFQQRLNMIGLYMLQEEKEETKEDNQYHEYYHTYTHLVKFQKMFMFY